MTAVFVKALCLQRAAAMAAAVILICGMSSCGEKPAQSPPVSERVPATNIRVSAPNADAAEPALAAGENGSIYVAYVEHNPDKSGDLYIARFDAELRQAGERVRVNPVDGEVKSWYGDAPSIAVSGGSVYVVWTRRSQSGGSPGTDVVLSVSGDGGRTFGEPVKVNDDKAPAAHGMHSLAVAGDAVYVSWLDERNVIPEKADLGDSSPSPVDGFVFVQAHHNPKQKAAADDGAEPNSEVFFAASTDGGKTFSKNVRVASDVCPCCKTATLASGENLFVGWRQVLPGSFRHIAVANSGDAGRTFSRASVVSDDRWVLSACPVSGPALATNDKGGLDVFWYTAGSAGDPGLYEAVSADGGRSFAPRRLISAQARSGTPVLVKDLKGTSLIFAENGERVVLEPSAAGGSSGRREFADAALPAAAATGEGVVVAYVKNEAGSRSVWLAR